MIIIPKKIDAIRALVGGGVSGPTDGSDTVFHRGQTPPTEEAIQAKLKELRDAEPMIMLRKERNRRLIETDWWTTRQVEGINMTQAQKDYRKSLRDLPSTASPKIDDDGNLTNVTWPPKPLE